MICLNNIKPRLMSMTLVGKKNGLRPGASFGKRVVKLYELDYITGGEGIIITDGKKIPAIRGRLFFREPGMVVEGIGPYHCYFMIIKLFEKDTNFHEIDTDKKGLDIPVYVDIEEKEVIENLLKSLYNEYLHEPLMGNFTKNIILMQLFKMLIEKEINELNTNINKGSKSLMNAGIAVVIEIINKNPVKNYTIEELAYIAGYNMHYFCRLFKKETGETAITYINKVRINHIRKELIETQKSIKEITLASNIENEAYFFKLFKKLTGTTPRQYRQRHREMFQ